MNFFDHKNLGNHLLQLCPKVVKQPVYYKMIHGPYNIKLLHLVLSVLHISPTVQYLPSWSCSMQQCAIPQFG